MGIPIEIQILMFVPPFMLAEYKLHPQCFHSVPRFNTTKRKIYQKLLAVTWAPRLGDGRVEIVPGKDAIKGTIGPSVRGSRSKA